MFWQDEDVQPAVNSANKIFGAQNQYYHGSNVLKNVTIMTAEYGKIWYGDVRMDTTFESGFRDKLKQLSKLINQRVCFTISNGNFDYTDTACESSVI